MKKILIIGEALVDDFNDHKIPGGAPFNVARHLAAFNIPLIFITQISNDENGRLIRNEFKKFNINQDFVMTDNEHSTGFVSVLQVNALTHEFIIQNNCAYDYIDLNNLSLLKNEYKNITHIYSGTLSLRNPVTSHSIHTLFDYPGIEKFVDFNWRNNSCQPHNALELVKKTHSLKINKEELDLILQWLKLPMDATTEEKASSLANKLFSLTPLRQLHVTLGEFGSLLLTNDQKKYHQPLSSITKMIQDTVGAGDAYAAILLLGKFLNWPITTTLDRASMFATEVCTIKGAVPSDLSFYNKWITLWQ